MNGRFSFFLIFSVILHLILLILIMLCKTVKFITEPPQEQVVFMHIMPLAKINNIKTRNEKQNDLPEKLEAKKVDKQHTIQPEIQQQQAPEPAKYQELEVNNKQVDRQKLPIKSDLEPKEAAIKQDPIKQDPIAQPKAQEDKKAKTEPIKQEKKLEKQPDKPKKKPAKKDSDDLDLGSLEKSLAKSVKDSNKEKASEGDMDKSKHKTGGKNKDNQTSSSSNYDANNQEAITSKSLLQKRIESNWSKPSSMRDYENIKVRVRLQIDMNQNIQEISGFEFLNEDAPQNVKNAIKESIIRAIKLSDPFDMLDIEYYQYWHDNSLIFSYR
jgi:hypothetical protein